MGLEETAAAGSVLNPALVTGAASLGAGAIGAYFGKQTNDANIAFQRQTNIENADMMYKAWNREDNAIVRRVQDLQHAGLSPVLAAGSAAGASSPIKMDAPHGEDYMSGAANMAIQSALAASNVSKTHMDIKKTAAEINNIEASTEGTYQGIFASDQNMDIQKIMTDYQTGAISAETARTKIDAARKAYELKRDQAMGLGEKSTPLSRQAQDAAGLLVATAKNDAKVNKKNDEARKNYPKGVPNLNDLWKNTKLGY